VVTGGWIELHQFGEGTSLEVTFDAVGPQGGHLFASNVGEGDSHGVCQLIRLTPQLTLKALSSSHIKGPPKSLLLGHDPGTLVLHLDGLSVFGDLDGEYPIEQLLSDMNVLFTVVLHLLGPVGPVGGLAKLSLVVTQAVAPGLQAVTAEELRWHPNRTLTKVPVQDVWVEHPAQNQRINKVTLVFKEWVQTLNNGDVESNDVVTDQQLCLSQEVDSLGN
jgi:hypothetical protein